MQATTDQQLEESRLKKKWAKPEIKILDTYINSGTDHENMETTDAGVKTTDFHS